MPWTFWVLMVLVTFVVGSLCAWAIIDAHRERRGDYDHEDPTWRDDYTGWG